MGKQHLNPHRDVVERERERERERGRSHFGGHRESFSSTDSLVSNMSPSFTVSFVILQMLCLENDCRLSLEVVLSVVRVPGKSSTPPKGYPGMWHCYRRDS